MPTLVESVLSRTLMATIGLILFLANAAPANPAPVFPRALVTIEDIESAIDVEWTLRKNYEVLPHEGEPWFTVLDGTSRVLISAPHATAQMREGKPKFADAGTGALAVLLNKLAKAPAIYTIRESPSDPNFYDDNDYKKKLGELIETLKPKLVLDLHASHWYRPYDIDFGTMAGQSLMGHPHWLQRLSHYLGKAGFRDFSQDYFPAAANQTVTKYVRGKGIPCIQMEINETWLNLFNETGIKVAAEDSKDVSADIPRVDKDGAHRFASTLEALVRFVDSVR